MTGESGVGQLGAPICSCGVPGCRELGWPHEWDPIACGDTCILCGAARTVGLRIDPVKGAGGYSICEHGVRSDRGPCSECPKKDEPSRVETSGVDLIRRERLRQITSEGYGENHDDRHRDASIAWAAVCYAAPERVYREERFAAGPMFKDPWPWHDSDDKRKRSANFPQHIPTDGPERVAMLVKAGALIAAEIDRLQRRAA